MSPEPFSDLSYEAFLAEEKLMGCRCADCGALHVPPRPLCPRCYGTNLQWQPIKGEGRLAAFTCIAIAPPFMADQGYGRGNPYCSGVIELDEGGKVDARIEGVDARQPESIRVGMPMKATFVHRLIGEHAVTFLAFEPR